MVRFRGNALGKVDDKGRIVFPAIFRDEFARTGEEDMTLVVKKSVQGNCLTCSPAQSGTAGATRSWKDSTLNSIPNTPRS